MKKAVLILLVTGVVIIAAVIFFGVLLEEDGTSTPTPMPTSTPMTTPISTPTPAPTPMPTPISTIATIGDTLLYSPWSITLHNVRYPAVDTWGDPPSAGKQFVVVDIELENITSEEQIFSTILQLNLVDSDGYPAEWNMWVETTGFIDGVVPAWGHLRGEEAYEARTGVSYYEIRIQPALLDTHLLIWRF